MLAAHLAAATDRLEEHVGLRDNVFDVVRQNESGEYVRANYLVVTIGMPETGGDRQARSQVHHDNAVFDFKLRAVGISPAAVFGLLNAVSQQWLGWVPTVPDRECSTMRYPEQTTDVQAETSVRPPLFFADVEYTLRSRFIQSGS